MSIKGCPMWAGNVCEQGFRDHWINEGREIFASGNYKGIWLDYVNMTLDEITDINGNKIIPYDYYGNPMGLVQWRTCMTEFTEQIRQAFPDKEIIHNPLWWYEYPTDSLVVRMIRSANFTCVERGINDAGLNANNFDQLYSFMDAVHNQGKGILFRVDSGITDAKTREYGLAGWFLMSNGSDAISSDPWSAPNDWWQGYDLNIGHALGDRYIWNNVYRRDFTCGIVLLNKPGSLTQNINLQGTFRTVDGTPVSSVTLTEKTGQILLKDCSTFQHTP